MTAQVGYGLTCELKAPDPSTTYTALGEVTEVSFSGLNRSQIRVTDLGDAHHQFLMGIVDSGTVTLGMNVDMEDAVLVELLETLDVNATTAAPEKRRFRLTYPGNGTVVFDAFVMNWAPSTGIDREQSASLTLKVTGAVTLTPVA